MLFSTFVVETGLNDLNSRVTSINIFFFNANVSFALIIALDLKFCKGARTPKSPSEQPWLRTTDLKQVSIDLADGQAVMSTCCCQVVVFVLFFF